MAAEACAERSEPPVSASRAFIERAAKREEAARTAHVSVVAEDFRGMPESAFRQAESCADSAQHIASAGVQQPFGDVAHFYAGARKNIRRKPGGKCGDICGEDVS